MTTPTQIARLIVARICKTCQLPVRGFKSLLPTWKLETRKKGFCLNGSIHLRIVKIVRNVFSGELHRGLAWVCKSLRGVKTQRYQAFQEVETWTPKCARRLQSSSKTQRLRKPRLEPQFGLAYAWFDIFRQSVREKKRIELVSQGLYWETNGRAGRPPQGNQASLPSAHRQRSNCRC